MTEDAPSGGEPPLPDDPFLAEDPAARERERRRREREARRAEREAQRPPAEPQAGPDPEPAHPDLGAELPDRDDDRRSGEPAEPVSQGRRMRSARAPGRLVARLGRVHPVAWVGIAFAAGALIFFNALFQPFHGSGEGRVLFEIPQGAGAGEVAELLDEEGVVSNATLFELRLILAGRRGDIFAGTYSLEQGMSYSAVIDELSTPPSERTIAITVPEGYSREQIARLATDAGLRGSYERASRRSNKLDPAKYGAGDPDSLEGFLFPATYELEAKASSKDLVAEQISSFKREFKKVGLGFAKSRNLTAYDVLIIASMIEREVMVAGERKLVSSVIYNRLESGEPLGIDATIRYATGNYDQPLKQSELKIDSPYNTRTNAGLPPTPIGNPGLKAIRAAAKPADTDFRYFVVKPGTCGEHEFVETQAEFDAAAARYNEAREQAGGKSPTEC